MLSVTYVSTGLIPGFLVTYFLHPRRSACEDPQLDILKVKEKVVLIEKGTFEVEYFNELPEDEEVLGERFVRKIPKSEIKHTLYKAILLFLGHTGPEKRILVHSFKTIPQHSFRVFIMIH